MTGFRWLLEGANMCINGGDLHCDVLDLCFTGLHVVRKELLPRTVSSEAGVSAASYLLLLCPDLVSPAAFAATELKGAPCCLY